MAKKPVRRTFGVPLQVRISDEQQGLFQQAADKARRSLSDWARVTLEDAARDQVGEPQEPKPKKG